jgi:radical SAM-linked protein
MQRLRVNFSRGEEVKFLSHLDLMRFWERALRRAGLTLAYSEGFSPHPRISIAAPLSVGVTSTAELMDIILNQWTSPETFTKLLSKQLPPGIELLKVNAAGLNEPSLQSRVRFAEYKVEIQTRVTAEEVTSALQNVLSKKEIPWHHYRDTGARYYDIRALIDDIWIISFQGSLCTLGMRLRCGSSGAGRPEQVTRVLGFTERPHSIQRTRLILE